MRNNSGLIRSLKNLNKKIDAIPKESKKKNSDVSFRISALALIISIISIYLQFFYESHNLKASLIDASVTKDSLSLNLIYQNKGNQDATIIKTEVFFFSDKNKNDKKSHIQFINKENDKLPPFILSPGKQIFHNFIQRVYFDENGLLVSSRTRNKDTLRVNLRINYITGNSLQAEDVLNCGWLTLDSLNHIKNWSIDYQNIALNSDTYFSKGYNYEKKK